MRAFLNCLAEAVAAKGVRGLVDWVPGGPYLYDVAADALKRLKQRRQHEELREEIRTAAEASFQDARAAAANVVAEVAPDAPAADKIALELYLSQVPGAVRRSLRRADDPTGRTVPPSFALNTPDDLLKVLPPQMPRFRAGDDVPGRLGWKLVEPLGAGGFGEVWRVENEENGRTYAVKFCTDATARHRLLKHEKVLVKRVQSEAAHPHIVGLEDSLLLDSVEVPWLAYEYVGGGDLAGLILSWQALPPEERARRALDVLAVLASTAGHFHQLNPPIVHRDLKPANILVDAATKRVRITDFGIGGIAAASQLSGSRDGATAYTRAVSMLSGAYTPIYASPQQQRGDPPDPRDDVHALGVIAYQMLTSRLDAGPGPKFERDLQKLNVPADVIQLIGDCVDPDAADRVADGTAVVGRIRADAEASERRGREAAEARARAEADNFRRWSESGEPDKWVEERGGAWAHADWVALTDRLRASAHWPLPLDAVGERLERAKQERAGRKAAELRRQQDVRDAERRAQAEAEQRTARERAEREQRERAERERAERERAERERAARERAARPPAPPPVPPPPPPAYARSEWTAPRFSDGRAGRLLVAAGFAALYPLGLVMAGQVLAFRPQSAATVIVAMVLWILYSRGVTKLEVRARHSNLKLPWIERIILLWWAIAGVVAYALARRYEPSTALLGTQAVMSAVWFVNFLRIRRHHHGIGGFVILNGLFTLGWTTVLIFWRPSDSPSFIPSAVAMAAFQFVAVLVVYTVRKNDNV